MSVVLRNTFKLTVNVLSTGVPTYKKVYIVTECLHCFKPLETHSLSRQH
jgi:hypothetical protein